MESSATRRRKQQKEKVIKGPQLTQEEKIELRSFITSLVVHTFILLCLALIYTTPVINKPIIVSLSFASDKDSLEPNLEINIPDISDFPTESSETEEQELARSSSVIAETMTNTSISIEQIDVAYEENSYDQKLLSETIPLENLVAIIDSPIVKNSSIENQTRAQQSEINILESLIKTTTAGLLSQNQNSDVFGIQPGSSSGTGSGISQRLAAAGAKTGDIQISIAWDTVDDIDLHVVVNMNGKIDTINWVNRFGSSGGMLDVDMNANNPPLINKPVENVFWPHKSYPKGTFMIGVHFFRSWTGNRQIPVLVRVKRENDIETFNVTAILGQNVQEVTRFNY